MLAHEVLTYIWSVILNTNLSAERTGKTACDGLAGIRTATCDEGLLETGARLETSFRRSRTGLVLWTCRVVGSDLLESFLFGGFPIIFSEV